MATGTGGSRAARRAALRWVLPVVAAAVLAGCGGGAAGPRLRTSAAERASWPRAPADAVRARVERVVDGDTFVATVGGHRERIRIIGVDTPETVAPGRPVQPYGREASGFAKHELTGRTVSLAGDVEPRDRYGRLLAYVWLPDGTFWNALLAAEGYAQQLTIPPNVAYAGLFRDLVAEARRGDRGLWARPGADAREPRVPIPSGTIHPRLGSPVARPPERPARYAAARGARTAWRTRWT